MQNLLQARVIPLLRLPRGMDVFDYEVPEGMEVDPGMIVRVPFRNKVVMGVVAEGGITTPRPSLKRRGTLTLKPIKSVLLTESMVPTYGFDFFLRMQEETCAPLSLLARTFLPPIPVRGLDALPAVQAPEMGARYASLQIPKTSVDAIEKLVQKRSGESICFWWHRHEERMIAMIKLIERAITTPNPSLKRRGGNDADSALVLFPNQEQLDGALPFLPKHLQATTAVLTSFVKPRALFATWRAIARGEKRVVLGTRMALLAPLRNLHTIIIDGDEMYGWKEEQTPRYDARVAATMLASVSGARLVTLSPAPRVETMISARRIATPVPLSTTTIVDLEELFKEKNFTYLSAQLRERIAALRPHEYGILFLNRKGFGAFMACADCGKTIMCPECALPFTHHREGGMDTLQCHHCLRTIAVPLTCPSCRGTALQSLGRGLERIESMLAREFPGTRIELLTHFGITTLPVRTETPAFLGVLDALHAMHLPDFRTLETTFQFLYKGRSYAAGKRIPFIIQSFSIELPLFTALRSTDASAFYTEELEQRKRHGYPPFMRLAKIIIRDEDREKGFTRAQAVMQLLTSGDPDRSVEQPTPGHPAKQRGVYVWNVIVRFSSTVIPRTLFKTLPHDAVIDVDPESLL